MKRISILVTVLTGGFAYGAGPMHGGHAVRPVQVVRPVHVVQPVHRVQHVQSTVFFVYRGEHSDRVGYSPYALEYGSSGLIPGYLRYSPYALEFGKSGLIPDTVQYSPYAFDNKRSGLISETGGGYSPSLTGDYGPAQKDEYDRSYAYGAVPVKSEVYPSWATSGAGPSWPAPSSQYRPTSAVGNRVAALTEPIEPDPKRTIQEYLKRTWPGGFEITRLVSMDNETVSFDVVLKDRNRVVKYWNGTKIQSIKRQGGSRVKAWNNYLMDWIGYRDQFETAGGKVCHITSEDTYELLRQLASCLDTDNR